MPTSIPALVRPEILVWARVSAGIDIAAAARRAGVAVERIENWERGSDRPSVAQLRKLGEIYKRPIAVFYLPEPPKSFDAMRDFRRSAGSDRVAPSPNLMFEVRRARQRRDVALDLATETDDPPSEFDVTATIDEEPDEVARRIRHALGVSLTEQFSWRDKYEALNNWKSAVEASGVLVFQSNGISVAEMRGFSESAPVLPLIVLNAKDSPRGRLFTLLHEYAHIALRTGGICDLHESTTPDPAADRIEVFCNRVAGAALVPPDAILNEPAVRVARSSRSIDDQSVALLADRYSVSREVLLRSLVLAGVVSNAFYVRKRQEFLDAYERDESQRRPAPVPIYRRAIGWNGVRYSRMVLNAYDEERITGSDLSDYLGVRLKHIEDIRVALAKREGAE